jgi:hypothetical protein
MSQVALRALTPGEREKQQVVKVRSGSQCNKTPSFFFQVSSLWVCVARSEKLLPLGFLFCFGSIWAMGSSSLANALPCCMLQ